MASLQERATSIKWLIASGLFGFAGWMLGIGAERLIGPSEILSWLLIAASVPLFALAGWIAVVLLGWQADARRYIGGKKIVPSLIIVIGFLVVGIGVMLYMVTPENKSPVTPTSLTLKDLFLNDFPNSTSTRVYEQEMLSPTGESDIISFRMCVFPQMGTVFASFYVPVSHETNILIGFIASRYREFMGQIPEHESVRYVIPFKEFNEIYEGRQRWPEKMSVNLIYVYHETPMSDSMINNLKEQFEKDAGLSVQFRSQSYVENERLRRATQEESTNGAR